MPSLDWEIIVTGYLLYHMHYVVDILVYIVYYMNARLNKEINYKKGLGRAAVCDCGTPWTFLLLSLLSN